ncbi:hypothetical protein F4776DRAFT_647447 [Hypoxylon sp. NC0597]|nr:hypothetical protein F4776DRAFT_647447 [Hypoxylon sp. NC0597]
MIRTHRFLPVGSTGIYVILMDLDLTSYRKSDFVWISSYADLGTLGVLYLRQHITRAIFRN